MTLHLSTSLESFVNGLRQSSLLTIPALNVINNKLYDPLYGLELFRKAIGKYEQRKGISPEQSKRAIPFFRENRRMLVGPEMEMYALSFYESNKPASPAGMKKADLELAFDYPALAEYCLLENSSLLRCSYDEEQSLQWFVDQLEQEYGKFFFDDEHTGFTRDSGFFSLLCNACLKVQEPGKEDEREWKLVRFISPEDAEYAFLEGVFTSFTSVSLPVNSLKRIKLLNREERPDEFSALAGFLQSKGLAPELILEGVLE